MNAELLDENDQKLVHFSLGGGGGGSLHEADPMPWESEAVAACVQIPLPCIFLPSLLCQNNTDHLNKQREAASWRPGPGVNKGPCCCRARRNPAGDVITFFFFFFFPKRSTKRCGGSGGLVASAFHQTLSFFHDLKMKLVFRRKYIKQHRRCEWA